MLFAYDSSVFCEGSDATEISNIFKAELQILDRWLISNKLSLNLLKIKYDHFSYLIHIYMIFSYYIVKSENQSKYLENKKYTFFWEN